MEAQFVMVRIDPALKAAIQRIAKADGRTVSSFVRKLMIDAVATSQSKGKAKP